MSCVFLLVLLTIAVKPEPAVSADAVFLNGKVWTVDPAKPEAQAIAVWRGRILKVGTDAEVKHSPDRTRKSLTFKVGGWCRDSTIRTRTSSQAASSSRASISRMQKTKPSLGNG